MPGLGWLGWLVLVLFLTTCASSSHAEVLDHPSLGSSAAVGQQLASFPKKSVITTHKTITQANGMRVHTITHVIQGGRGAPSGGGGAQPCVQPCQGGCQVPCQVAPPAPSNASPTKAPRKLSHGDIKHQANRVQKMAQHMLSAFKKKKDLLPNPKKFGSKKAEENVAKMAEEVQALLKAVKGDFGKKGAKISSDTLARLEGAVKNLDWHMQKDLRPKQGSMSLAEMKKYAGLINSAQRTKKQAKAALHQMNSIQKTAAGTMNIIRAAANTLKVISDAQRQASQTAKRDLSANRADMRAAGASLQAAEGAASTVGVGKSQSTAKRAAQIAAGQIESARTLDAATRRSARVSTAVGQVTTATFKALAEEAQVFNVAADETSKMLATTLKHNKKAAAEEAESKKDAKASQKMVMKVVNAQSHNGANAAKAVAKTEIVASRAKTAEMERNGLDGLKKMTKTVYKAEDEMADAIKLSEDRIKLPLKELMHDDKKLVKDEKRTAASGIARSVISAGNSAQQMKDVKSKRKIFKLAERAAAKSSEATVKVSQKSKQAQELISMASATAARNFAQSITKRIDGEAKIIKESAKQAKKLEQEARKIKLATQNTDSKSNQYVHRKTNEVLKRTIKGLKTMLTKLSEHTQKMAQQTKSQLQAAEQAAANLASKDKRSHERVKQVQKTAEAANKKVAKFVNRAENALVAEKRAAKAAKRDEQKNANKLYIRSEKVAKKEIAKARTAEKDTASAAAGISAIKNAVRFGEKPGENALQAVVDAMQSAQISAKSVAAGFRTAKTADVFPGAVAGAGVAARKYAGALERPQSVHSFVERQKAQAVAAAEQAAAAVLQKGSAQLKKGLAPEVVLAAVRRTDAKTNVAEIISSVKANGVKLTPAAVSAALHSVKMPAHKIAKALSAMGVSLATICDSISMLSGSTNPASVARATARAGFAVPDIVSGLSEAGLANSKNMMNILTAAGLKISQKEMHKAISSGIGRNPGHKVVDAAQKVKTKTGMPSGAASTIAALKKAGLPVTPINVAKSLKKIGMSTADTVRTLTALTVVKDVIAAAMKQAGFTTSAVERSENKVTSSSQVNEAVFIQINGISQTASDVIRSMLKKKISLSKANLQNALKGEGVKVDKIEKIVALVHPSSRIAQLKAKAKELAKELAGAKK